MFKFLTFGASFDSSSSSSLSSKTRLNDGFASSIFLYSESAPKAQHGKYKCRKPKKKYRSKSVFFKTRSIN